MRADDGHRVHLERELPERLDLRSRLVPAGDLNVVTTYVTNLQEQLVK
ncbi:MAG TPA: hypothetical protein VIX73_22050 [Kofleriaceae bacterium]